MKRITSYLLAFFTLIGLMAGTAACGSADTTEVQVGSFKLILAGKDWTITKQAGVAKGISRGGAVSLATDFNQYFRGQLPDNIKPDEADDVIADRLKDQGLKAESAAKTGAPGDTITQFTIEAAGGNPPAVVLVVARSPEGKPIPPSKVLFINIGKAGGKTVPDLPAAQAKLANDLLAGVKAGAPK